MTAALSQQFGKANLTLRGQYDSLSYGSTPLSDGTTLSNSVRDLSIYTGTIKLGYEFTPAFAPFVEATYNLRDYSSPIDAFGLRQGSEGVIWRAGWAFNFAPKLNGEAAIGYLDQHLKQTGAGNVTGITYDGFINWSVSPLTSVKFTAASNVLDTNTAGSTGGITRQAGVSIEHLFQRNLTGTAGLTYGQDDYSGILRTDKRLTAALGTIWRVNRNLSLKATASHERITSNQPGNSYSTSVIEGGLRWEY